MEKSIFFEGHQAKTYIEAFLFACAREKSDTIKTEDLKRTVLSTGLVEYPRQMRDALRNLRNLKLVADIDENILKIDTEKTKAFARDYVADRVRIWYSPKGQAKAPAPGATAPPFPRTDTDRPRIDRRTPAADQDQSPGPADSQAPTNAAETATPPTTAQDRGPAEAPAAAPAGPDADQVATSTPAIIGKVKKIDIVRALYAASYGPATVNDILDLAGNYGHGDRVNRAIVSYYHNRHPSETAAHFADSAGFIPRVPSKAFFEINLHKKGLFCSLLPQLRDLIESNFKHALTGEVEEVEEEQTAAANPAGPIVGAPAPVVGGITKTDVVRAIYAAIGAATLADVEAVAEENGHGEKIGRTNITYYHVNYSTEVAKLDMRGPSGTTYRTPTKHFFKVNRPKARLFCALLPALKEKILNNFENPESIEENAAAQAQAAGGRKPAPGLNPMTGQMLIRAILAAYRKPLTLHDMQAIAHKAGRALPAHVFYYYQRQHGDEMVRDVESDINGRLRHTASAKLFDRCAAPATIAAFKEVLPFKAEDIDAAFARHQAGGQVVEEEAKAADPGLEFQSHDDDGAPVESQDDDGEAVDAANVGAAIVCYIQKLKKQLQDQAHAVAAAGADGDHKRKLENMAGTMAGLKAERDGLQTRVNKLAAIIEEKDRRLNEAIRELAEFKEKADKGVLIPSSFKMDEVARITKLIKGGRK